MNKDFPEDKTLRYGFTKGQEKLWAKCIVMGSNYDITNDEKIQEEIIDFIKEICNMNNISFYSKLDKIKTLIEVNKGFKTYEQNYMNIK